MPPSKLLIGGAGAAAVLGIRVARTLHGRWHRLPSAARAQLEPLAEDAKRRALDLRGSADPETGVAELRAANETLAAALVETAEANPDISSDEVSQLRDDLRSELERLANADVKASRSGLSTQPPG